MAIRRLASIPLYHQIRELLREEILGGKCQPGDRIPSEHELSVRYGVSRITAKQAVEDLAKEGLVYRVQGKGTFVAKPRVEHNLTRLISFSEQMVNRGMKPSTQVLEKEVVVAREEVVRALALPEQSLVYKLRRLRLADGEVMGLQTAFVSTDLCPNLLEEISHNISLYMIFKEKYGLVPCRASETYNAILLSAYEASLLQVPEGSPALLVSRTAYLKDGRPLEHVISFLRGDRYTLYVELSSQGESGEVKV